jgi:hypothetical protein
MYVYVYTFIYLNHVSLSLYLYIFYFPGNSLENDFDFKNLSNVKNLTHLVLDENDLEDEGIMNLAESIKNNQSIQTLSVIACSFSTMASYVLFKTLV